ncbi:hypothetical protein NP284_32605 [Rhodopseudomonas pseudopalustris]|uniref:hypothetical protein n=1 Tax=Rhodopseudomonas pseudopalustris TaxID=1513892 RepID=UPI003F9A1B44
MTSIANSTSGALSRSPLPIAATAAKDSPATAAATATAKATNSDTVELSDQAKALLQLQKDLSMTFEERLQKRSDALAEKLSKAFAKINVNLDEAVRLKVDKFGNVTSEGPWKEKIEKLFRDDPDLAKELKEISALNALKAAQTALELYNKEKGAPGSAQQSDAWTRYNLHSMNIQTLSGVISLQDGKLRSAAVDYMDMITDPTGTAASAKDVANRLA